MPAARKTVRVPASSANLGPGFDALALALSLYLECRFRPAETLAICATGRDSGSISTGEDNLIWQTALRVAADTGAAMPPIELEIANDIPIGKGLGSSAAALTAGVVIANEVLGLGWDAHRVLDEAAQIEGHPDNVAACVLGSIVASAIDSEGVARAVRLELDPHYNVAVVVPDFVLPTSEARRVLPDDLFARGHRVQRAAQRATDRRAGHGSPGCVSDGARRPAASALSLSSGAGAGGDHQAAGAGSAGVRAERGWSVDSGVPRARPGCRLRTGARVFSRATGTSRRSCARRYRRKGIP